MKDAAYNKGRKHLIVRAVFAYALANLHEINTLLAEEDEEGYPIDGQICISELAGPALEEAEVEDLGAELSSQFQE